MPQIIIVHTTPNLSPILAGLALGGNLLSSWFHRVHSTQYQDVMCVITWMLCVGSPQTFAHAPTAVLLGLVQNFVVICALNLEKMFVKLRKKFDETLLNGPWILLLGNLHPLKRCLLGEVKDHCGYSGSWLTHLSHIKCWCWWTMMILKLKVLWYVVRFPQPFEVMLTHQQNLF